MNTEVGRWACNLMACVLKSIPVSFEIEVDWSYTRTMTLNFGVKYGKSQRTVIAIYIGVPARKLWNGSLIPQFPGSS